MPRTLREAYGYNAAIGDPDKWDRRIFIGCAIGAAFLIGLMLGGTA